MANSVILALSAIPDPRGDRGRRHRLIDVLTIGVLSVLCGADHWTQMQDFGESREPWLRTFLELPHGIPSADTFGEVFAAINPDAFEAAFQAWTRAVAGELRGVVAIDGKTIRRSFDAATGKSAVHMVSAWAAENGVVLGQLSVEGKSNELAAIPALLGMLRLKGLIVTIDAGGCQKALAAQITKQQASYVLAVKDNQPTLHADVKEMFQWAERRGFAGLRHAQFQQTSKGHGRVEIREVDTLWELGQISTAGDWPGLSCIVRSRATRIIGKRTATEDRYFISSVPQRREGDIPNAIRAHWGIENGLHWVLDVSFGEDSSRVRQRHAAANLSRLRRLTMNILKLAPPPKTTRKSIPAKRFIASLDPDYLNSVLWSMLTEPNHTQTTLR